MIASILGILKLTSNLFFSLPTACAPWGNLKVASIERIYEFLISIIVLG
jgi:hypothetical protein